MDEKYPKTHINTPPLLPPNQRSLPQIIRNLTYLTPPFPIGPALTPSLHDTGPPSIAHTFLLAFQPHASHTVTREPFTSFHYQNAKDFLECQNKTAKESIVSLAVDIHLKGNIYFLRVEEHR
jgi:hypothetical protein